jgi:putative membrane protein
MSRLVCPPAAALLDVGGLWLLYRTRLFAETEHNAFLHAVVHAHVVAAGLLFSFAVCQLDPVRRRWSLAVRGGALLAAGAAHAVLARLLYASPPPGTAFTGDDLHTGARLMYYGGDLVEAALAVALGVAWYTTRERRDTRRALSRRPQPAPGGH